MLKFDMESSNGLKMQLDTEEIVKLQCTNDRCRFNMVKQKRCGLKHVVIDDHGQCFGKEEVT